MSIDTLVRGDDSRLVEPRRFVVRDAQSFAAVWAAHAGPDAIPPTVDFETRMVAAVFAGHRPTPGYVVTIADARRQADALVIVVEETAPDPSQPIAQVMTSPFHVALLPRDDGPIRFDTEDAPGQSTIVFKPRGTPAQPRDAKVAPRVQAQSSSARAGMTTAAGESSTGLTPPVAAAMAYLGGPFSGALVLATERTSGFVRFHAWQALIGLGALGLVAVSALVAAFAFLVFSPTAFWVMLWLSAAVSLAWVAAWGVCLVQAAQGRVWKLPIFGNIAARRATSPRASASK